MGRAKFSGFLYTLKVASLPEAIVYLLWINLLVLICWFFMWSFCIECEVFGGVLIFLNSVSAVLFSKY